MNKVCKEHRNPIQKVCLDPLCQERALCLLCEHHHGGPFQSIMAKTSESYKTFESILNKAIDTYLVNRSESTGNKVLIQQSSLIKSYFKEVRA